MTDPKPWLDSKTIRSLIAAEALLILQWLSVCVAADAWEWRSLLLGSIAIAIPAIKRLADPDIDAPIGMLNRTRPPG